jgi:signal transduction histidine kinase
MRILVVEDEPNVVDFIEKGLKEEGYVVDVATDGELALDFAHYTDQGHVDLAATPAADSLQICVSDTGQGIPPEHLPYLFQLFYRVDLSRSQSRGNVGLGLTLTYELAQLLGGQIEVTSQPQTGTTFTLTLPSRQPYSPKISQDSVEN